MKRFAKEKFEERLKIRARIILRQARDDIELVKPRLDVILVKVHQFGSI